MLSTHLRLGLPSGLLPSFLYIREIIDTLSGKSRYNYFVDDSHICGCATLIGRIINICVRTPEADYKWETQHVKIIAGTDAN